LAKAPTINMYLLLRVNLTLILSDSVCLFFVIYLTFN
jgi:hypothetical protein